MQQELFRPQPLHIQKDGLSLQLIPDFLPPQQSVALFEQLLENSPWQQARLKVYGKWHSTPRLVCLYADQGLQYQYSGTLHSSLPWTQPLLSLKHHIEQASGSRFNSVLLNQYRNGQDTMGWHADDETELGTQPLIASFSLGASRDIHFKTKHGVADKICLSLANNSLLLMMGDTQKHWLHHIPKRARCTQPRINLTFRRILKHTVTS